MGKNTQLWGIVLLLSWATAPAFLFNKGTLEPKDPSVAVGGVLTLTCTLTGYTGNHNASDIYFIHNSKEIPATEVVSASVARLVRSNMKMEDEGYYRCNVNESKSGGNASWISSQFVKVGYPAVKPTNISCVSENWESMTCRWCTGRDPNIQTVWSLNWSILNKALVECPSYKDGRCSCFFAAENFTKPTKYHFILRGINKFGNVTLNDTVTSNPEIVKPNLVESLSVTPQSNTTIQTNWSYPHRLAPTFFPLVFRVRCTAQWDNVMKTIPIGKETSHLLSGLTPYTWYNVSVSSMPKNGIYWSDDKSLKVLTPEGTPAMSPPLTPGSFQKEADYVTLFWKPIPTKYRHGVINSHVVNYGRDRRNYPSGEMQHLNLPYQKGKSVEVEISACTRIGCAATPSKLHIPAVGPTFPQDVTAELKGNTTTITWVPSGNPDRYTIYMCQGIRSKVGCQDELKWYYVEGNARQWEISLPGNALENQKFSLSVDKLSSGMWRSSGMMPWLCVYHYDGVPSEGPRVSVSVTEERSLHAIWRPLECDKSRGKTQFYVIQYQQLFYNGTKGVPVTRQTNRTQYLIRDLLPDTRYEVSVAAHTRTPGPFGEVVALKTAESAPGLPPLAVTSGEVKAFSVKMTWQPSPVPNGIVKKYRILAQVGEPRYRLRRYLKRSVDGDVEMEVSGQLTEAEVGGLMGDTRYAISVSACTQVGCSPGSTPPVMVKTLIGAPATVARETIKIDDDSPEDEITLTWGRPHPPNGPISFYQVLFSWENDDGLQKRVSIVPGDRMTLKEKFVCNGTEVKMNYSVAAVNRDESGVEHQGVLSQVDRQMICSTPPPVVGIVLGSVIASAFLSVLVAVLIWKYRRCQKENEKKFVFEAIKKPPRLDINTHKLSREDDYRNSINIDIPSLPNTPDESSALIKFDKDMGVETAKDKDSDDQQKGVVAQRINTDLQRPSPVQRSVSEDSGTGTSLASEQTSRSPLSSASDEEEEARMRNPSGSQGSRKSLLPEIPEDEHESLHMSPDKKQIQQIGTPYIHNGRNGFPDPYYSKFAVGKPKEPGMVQLLGLDKCRPKEQELTVAFIQGQSQRGPQQPATHPHGSMDYYVKVGEKGAPSSGNSSEYIADASSDGPISEYSKFCGEGIASKPSVNVNGYVEGPTETARAEQRVPGAESSSSTSSCSPIGEYSKFSKTDNGGISKEVVGPAVPSSVCQGYVANVPSLPSQQGGTATSVEKPEDFSKLKVGKESAGILDNAKQPEAKCVNEGYVTVPSVNTAAGYVAAPPTGGTGGYVAAPPTGGAGGYIVAPPKGGAGGNVAAPLKGGAGGNFTTPPTSGTVDDVSTLQSDSDSTVEAPPSDGRNDFVGASLSDNGGYVGSPPPTGTTDCEVAQPSVSAGADRSSSSEAGYVSAPPTAECALGVAAPQMVGHSNCVTAPSQGGTEYVKSPPTTVTSGRDASPQPAPKTNGYVTLPTASIPTSHEGSPAKTAAKKVAPLNGYIQLPTSPDNTSSESGGSEKAINTNSVNGVDTFVKQPSRDSGYVQSPSPGGLTGSPNFPVKGSVKQGDTSSTDNGYDSPPDSPVLKMGPAPLTSNGYVKHIPMAQSEC